MVAKTSQFDQGRHAGLLLPLFSAPSRRSWGIGEIGDLPVLSAWLRQCGLDFLQVLPLNEMPAGQRSPYSAVSAMAIDPIYISLWAVPDLDALGGEAALSSEGQQQLREVRAAARIDYSTVRRLKMSALRAAFGLFLEREWRRKSRRAQDLRRYLERERWWVDDYALYRALRELNELRPWWEWEAALATRDATAIRSAREALADEWLFFAYLQWIADTQWHDARQDAAPVGTFGDVAFMVSRDSADVWANQHAFRVDATVGAPPDAFSETGQDWGFPVYRWDVFATEKDAWIRARARRSGELFNGYRVDHVVGFYRTYVIPADGHERTFSPPDEPSQLGQGERVMRAFLESGPPIVAEDLGTVPDFVRESLKRLGIPGYKVLRWEREWKVAGQPFRDPLSYPPTSIATTGTHDTETLVEWWETAPPEERDAVAQIPFLRQRLQKTGTLHPASEVGTDGCGPSTRDAILELLVASASNLVILPVQDVFGWRDRINVPATVTDDNWTWRLPWPVDELSTQPDAQERAETLQKWMRVHRRSPAVLDSEGPKVSSVRAR